MDEITLLKKLLKKSLSLFYANDATLLYKTGAERSCQGRIMIYMEHLLHNDPMFVQWCYYNIDCEYHWSEGDQKRYHSEHQYAQPDIILHIRNSNEHNLMVVEFKYNSRASNSDIEKLQALTDKQCEYNYILGCSVNLTQKKPVVCYFRNGQQVCKQ